MEDHRDILQLVSAAITAIARVDANIQGKKFKRSMVNSTHVDAAIMYLSEKLGPADQKTHIGNYFVDPPVAYIRDEHVSRCGFPNECSKRIQDACNGLILISGLPDRPIR